MNMQKLFSKKKKKKKNRGNFKLNCCLKSRFFLEIYQFVINILGKFYTLMSRPLINEI